MSHLSSNLAPDVLEFFEKYLTTGHLVDLYSEAFVSHLEHEAPDALPISLARFKSLDRRFGTEYRSHLFVLYLGDQTAELIAEVFSLFPGVLQRGQQDDSSVSAVPFLLLLNRALGLIRTVRVSSLGAICFNDFGPLDLTRIGTVLRPTPLSTDQQFYALDYCHFARRLMCALRKLIQSAHTLKALPYCDELPTKHRDGLFYFPGSSTGLTRTKAAMLLNKRDRSLAQIDEAIFELSSYFSMINLMDAMDALDLNSI